MSPTVTATVTIERKKSPSIQYYQLLDDFVLFGGLRSCASGGCPAVFPINDRPDTIFGLDWQMYLVAINPGMSLAPIIAIIGDSKALANNTGFGDEDNPRANYITGKSLSSPPPRYDKFRAFVGDTHSGTEINSLRIGISELLSSAREAVKAIMITRSALARKVSFASVRSALAAVTSTNTLKLLTLDGRTSPPMKPGARRPQRVEEIVPSDYLILPSPEYRHFFMDCKNIKAKPGGGYNLGPWANGSLRPWIGDDRPHTFAPFVSQFEIFSPLKYWKKIPLGDPFPYPFTERS